jgi:NTP pyrophosphatase (non-canonical NTP hydrolase)
MTKTEQVKEFHDKFWILAYPSEDLSAVKQRKRLIREEFLELNEALNNGDPESILKECCDLVYVVIGSAVVFGMDFDEAFNRVHASNMTKVWEDGRPRYREDGKVLKPPTYKSPDLKDLI